MNAAVSGCFNAHVQATVGGADESFNSGWTKPGWEAVKAVPSFGKPKKVFESPLLVSPGACSKNDEQHLEVIAGYLGDLFKKPDVRMAVLDNLKARPEIAKLDECPTFTEIRTASRRLRFSAGGVDGLRPEHLKAVCQDNDLFRDCVAKYVVDFWEDLRVPKT